MLLQPLILAALAAVFFVSLFSVVAGAAAAAGPPTTIKLLGIVPETGNWVDAQGISAMTLAVEDINARDDLLPDTTLEVAVVDGGCSRGITMRAVLAQCGPRSSAACGTAANPKYMDAIIGPACSAACQSTARLSEAWQIPQISWACTSPSLSDKTEYPFFVRAVTPTTIIMDGLLELTALRNWRHLAVLTETSSELFTFSRDYLLDVAKQRNVTVLADETVRKVPDIEAGGGKGVGNAAAGAAADDEHAAVLSTMRAKLETIKRDRGSVRVLAFMGYSPFLRLALKVGRELGMTGPGWEWVEVGSIGDCILRSPACPGPGGETIENDKLLLEAVEGVVSFIPSPPDRATAAYRSYASSMLAKHGIPEAELSTWAMHAHEAIHQYAHALHAFGKDPHSNSSAFFSLMRSTKFQGVAGWYEQDAKGDRAQRYSVVNFQDTARKRSHTVVANYVKLGADAGITMAPGAVLKLKTDPTVFQSKFIELDDATRRVSQLFDDFVAKHEVGVTLPNLVLGTSTYELTRLPASATLLVFVGSCGGAPGGRGNPPAEVGNRFIQNEDEPIQLCIQWENCNIDMDRGNLEFLQMPATGGPARTGTVVFQATCGFASFGLRFFVNLLAAVGLAVAVILMLAVWVWRKHPAIRHAQPFFLNLIILGYIMSTLTLFGLAAADDDGAAPTTPKSNGTKASWPELDTLCMIQPWFYWLGFAVSFSSLMLKTWRIKELITNIENLQRVKISEAKLALYTVGLMIIMAIFLATWTVVSPLRWTRQMRPGTQESFGLCTSEGGDSVLHWAFIGPLLAMQACLLIYANVLVYQSRRVHTYFNEGKWISLAMVSNLQVFALSLPVMFIVAEIPGASLLIKGLAVWLNDFALLGFIFFPKMVYIQTRSLQVAKQDARKARDTIAASTSERLFKKHEMSKSSKPSSPSLPGSVLVVPSPSSAASVSGGSSQPAIPRAELESQTRGLDLGKEQSASLVQQFEDVINTLPKDAREEAEKLHGLVSKLKHI